VVKVNLSQDRDPWEAYLKTTMNILVPICGIIVNNLRLLKKNLDPF
jgi:hypothetical protein